jgi:hypothetical protein
VPQSDSRGLATLLVVRLAQQQELYRVVDEQRALSTEAKSNYEQQVSEILRRHQEKTQ